MPLRVIKIILPEKYGNDALALLNAQEKLDFWLEESSRDSFVASLLTDSGRSESIMDLFEKQFSSVPEFKLILFPIEGTIPRLEQDAGEHPREKDSPGSGQDDSPPRVSREELYNDIVDSTRLSRVFVFMTILSTIVAAIGLIKSNVAVIIGAMVIAPFLGPNVALALSTNLSDKDLGTNALKTLCTGVFLVILLSVAMGYVFGPSPEIPEIAARTQADFFDIILAIASGCAGVLAFTTGASSAVIGVMVAVALLPPLTTAGLLMGAGHVMAAGSAFLLFMTNIICINLAGVVTFLIQGVSPRSWWEADKARKGTRTALLLWTVILAILSVIIHFW